MNQPTSPHTVVLTGGIASGKSTVTDLFAEKGVTIVDTDVLAREVVKPGSSGLQQLVQRIGDEIIDEQGQLKRRHLRTLIMNNPPLRQAVEQILHPLIEQRALQLIQQASPPYCIVAVPLYVESGKFKWADRVLVIDVPEATQIQRLIARDHVDREQAEATLAAQASRDQRLAVADDIINNTGTLADLEEQVARLHRQYLQQFSPASP